MKFFSDASYKIYFWWNDEPFQKMWHGAKTRFLDTGFCIQLLILAIWDPALMKRAITDRYPK